MRYTTLCYLENPAGEYLMLHRVKKENDCNRDKWIGIGGKFLDGESPEECALREIREETGLDSRILRHLGTIDYWFTGTDRRVHKVVHHFLLARTGGSLTVEDDPDGEAEDVAWVPMADLVERLAYPNERRIASLARDVLTGKA